METPKQITACPICTNKYSVKLAVEKFKHIPTNKNYALEGDWWIYKCCVCGEGFTTTESDDISMKNLKQRRL